MEMIIQGYDMILIDSHVHIHSNFELNGFIGNVFKNFNEFTKDSLVNNNCLGILCLTEIEGTDYFSKLKSKKIILNKKFNIVKTDEDESVIIQNNNDNKIVLIKGHQIVSSEGLEVLSLCSKKRIESGKDIVSTITKIIKVGGITILPWGVGKWIGKKREIIEELILSELKFFIGDNSGRLKFIHEPALFHIAKKNKHFVLPGTDALPIKNQINKTGKFGFILQDKIDLNKPAQSLKNILLNLDYQPEQFGDLECFPTFLKNQISMQIKKHLK